MSDPLEKSIEAIIKQLPAKEVYQDGLSGATKQIGFTLEDMAKSVRLALAPFQFLGAFQDRVAAFIERSVRRIPEDRRMSPAPQIVGPVLEGIRFEPEGTPIDEMFSQLLSRSMDSERVGEAHPAYPIIIKQLSPDEAIILAGLNGKTFDYVYTQDFDAGTNTFRPPNPPEIDDLPKVNLNFANNTLFYFEHLDKLGLAGIFQTGNQEPLHDPSSRKQVGVRVRSEYRLTDFGRRFVQACTSTEVD
jgi:Abortive infection alpha